MPDGLNHGHGRADSFAGRLGAWLDAHARLAIGSAVALTFALSIPMLVMQPTETASQYPDGEVIEAQSRADELFAGPVHRVLLVAEARNGDILTKEALLELYESGRALAAHPRLGRILAATHHPGTGTRATGLFTVADAVDRVLHTQGIDGLAAASDPQVAGAVEQLLADSSPSQLGLAVQTAQADDGRWTSPAAVFAIDADNAALGGGGMLVTIGTDDTTKEQFARDVLEVFRERGEHLEAWTVAADLNLTSNEQGAAAGPYITMTIVAVLAIIGFSFRSYWAVAISGAALGMLMVWLKGGSNLIGLENDQLLATVVPISMISFGIDSAFHAIGRYREHGASGMGPGTAFVAAVGGVLAALALAVTSDAVAFLSNVTSNIESVVQFGLAAALAAASAFLLLGLAAPLALSQVEQRLGSGSMTRWGPRAEVVFGLLAAVGAAIPVMAIVFISPALGIALLGLYFWLALVWPYQARRANPVAAAAETPRQLRSDRLARLVRSASDRSGLTLAVASILTLGMLWSASRLETRFDVRDFFSEDVDFVVGLDKVDRYVGDRGGEPATVLIEADLTQPQILAVIDRVAKELTSLESNRLARTESGEVVVHRGVLELVERVMGSPIGLAAVETATGLRPTDANGDRFPDTPEDAGAILTTIIERGLPSIDRLPPLSPEEAGVFAARTESGGYATTLGVEIPNTKVQSNIVEARAALEPLTNRLDTELQAVDPDAGAILTGSAVFRDEQLSAIFRSLLVALPVAVLACMTVAAAFMRSIRFALVSVVPILVVVVWLYGIMQLAGYGINVVTAIIGAVSVGVGIDFATHFVMRYLEEARRHKQPLDAMEAAGAGTGTALLGSAGTSVVGFSILALAPMPMFATYGILTAVMIALALAASLIVLPALLIRLTPPGVIRLEIPEEAEGWATAVLGSMAATPDGGDRERARIPVEAASSAAGASPNGETGPTKIPLPPGRATSRRDTADRVPPPIGDPPGGNGSRHIRPPETVAAASIDAGSPVPPSGPEPPNHPLIDLSERDVTAVESRQRPPASTAGAEPPPETGIDITDRRPENLRVEEPTNAVPPSWNRPVGFTAPDIPPPRRPDGPAAPVPQASASSPASNVGSEPFLRLGLATDLPPTTARLSIASTARVSDPRSIRLLDGAGEDLIREIRGGILDIAVVTAWPGETTVPPGVKAGKLLSTDLALAVRSGSSLRRLSDLENATWISGPPWSPHDDAVAVACARAGFRPFITHRVTSIRLALDIVRGTGAITLLPRAVARESDISGVTLHSLPDLGRFHIMVVISDAPVDGRVERAALAIREAAAALTPAPGTRPD